MSIKIKNDKKAFLLGEYTLKVIIAVFSLLLLFYLLFSLYSNNEKQKDLQLAKASLGNLIEGLELSKKGEIQEITLLSPVEWRLLYYKKGDLRPISCVGNCFCVCPTNSVFDNNFFKNQIDMCNKEGVCEGVSLEVSFQEQTLPVDLMINYNQNKYTISNSQ